MRGGGRGEGEEGEVGEVGNGLERFWYVIVIMFPFEMISIKEIKI